MRIPSRVNTLWDVWSRYFWQPARAYPGLGVATALMVGSLLTLPFHATLAMGLVAAASALLLGWLLHTPKTTRLQRDLDASQREVGHLGHLLRQAVRGQVTESALQTARLPRIGGDNS